METRLIMPTYDFKCPKCGHRFDVFKSIHDETDEICPVCGEKAKRLIGTGAAIIFKGNGFYITDYEHKHSFSS